MTPHPPHTAAKTEPQPPALGRLRMRETALRQQAAQLQARAEHLERVGHMQAQQLKRRVDAHEKIVLGALLKKAGMAWPWLTPRNTTNGIQTTTMRRRFGKGLPPNRRRMTVNSSWGP